MTMEACGVVGRAIGAGLSKAAAAQPEQQCDGCFFFKGREFGQCHRRSPVIVPHLHDAPETCWPIVRCDDWCGEYQKVC